MPLTPLAIHEGKVFEVLHGCGLASLELANGSVVTVDRHTAGIVFAKLKRGQRFLCFFDRDQYRRVIKAELMGGNPANPLHQ